MSVAVNASTITKRAKCRRSNSPNGTSALCGSTMPGRRFIEPSRDRSSSSRPSATGARTRKFDCGFTLIARR
jgi:hypothetical protein